MKKYIIAFLLCFISCSSWARSTNVVIGEAISSDTFTPAWYYSTLSNTDSYDQNGGNGSSYLNGTRIPNLSGISGSRYVSKLSMKFNSVVSATECYVELARFDTDHWDRLVGSAITPASISWVDVTVSDTLINTSDILAVFFQCNGDWGTPMKRSVSGQYGYYKASSYTSPLPDPISSVSDDDDTAYGARIWLK